MSEKKKKKQKTTVALPKAWQSVKHRNETANARTNYEDAWKALGYVIAILAIAFVLLGGISQTGALKVVLNWSHNVGEKVSTWIAGGSIVTNKDGIYIDPSGQSGNKIDNDGIEVENPADLVDKVEGILDEDTTEDNNETPPNSEVKNE